MKIGFETVVNYLPDEVLDVKSDFAYLNPSIAKLPEAVLKKVNAAAPEQVRRLKDVSAAEMMSVAVAKKALDKSGLKALDIDCLLITQTGGKQFMPLLASYVHRNVGFRSDIMAMNIVDDAASILDAANVAWNFVQCGLCSRVLIIAVAAQISGEVRFGVDLTDPMARNYGDGAAAGIVSAQNLKCEFLSYHFETYAVSPRPGGTMIALLGPVRPLVNPELAMAAGIEDKSGAYEVLYDPLFDEVVSRKGFVSESLQRAAKKAGKTVQDIELLITSHIGDMESAWIEDIVTAGMRRDTFRNLRYKYGNTGCADTLIDLAEFLEEGRLTHDSVLALWMPSAGVQLATLILRWF